MDSNGEHMINKATKINGVSQSNVEAWRIVGDVIIKGSSTDITYTMQDIAEVSIDALPDECTPGQAREVIKVFVLAEELTDEEIDLIYSLYPVWNPKQTIAYGIDTLLHWSGKLYRVVQPHIPQSDWEPQNVPALFVVAYPTNIVAPWVQPTGGHDAYSVGDKVSFNSATYESLIDANVWSPAAYPAGWKKV